MLSQPAVSLQLKSLERDLGLPLFQRGGPKLLLTDAGEVLYRAAASILFAKDEAERAIGELRDGTKGRLIVGAGTTGGMYVLPRILQAYTERWPGTEIVMQVGTTDQLLERLLQNGLDLAIVGGPIEDRRFKTDTICTDVLVLVAAPTPWGRPEAPRRSGTSRRSPSPSDGPPAARRASLDARPTRSCAESAGRIRGNRSMALVNPHGHDRRLRPLRLGGRDAAEARR